MPRKSTHIGVGLVNQGVEQLNSFPYAHTSTLASFKVDPGFNVEGHGLLFCIREKSAVVQGINE
jgi:hypothetical protein